MRVYNNIIELIANPENPTPLVRLNKIVKESNLEVFIKLEWYNPFGSIKDRIALKMIQDGEKLDGKSLVEASSGNTGIALAAIANVLEIPIEIAIPERAPEEKKVLLKLLGVTLWESNDNLCPMFPFEGARGLARGLYESPKHKDKYVYPNQYENEINVKAHYETTGPEIWLQTKGEIDYFFAGYGTTGTLSGVGKYLKEKKDTVKIIGVEPLEPVHKLPGLKNISKLAPEYLPTILDTSIIDETIGVSDDDAYKTAIRLAREEGLIVGPSTGAIVHALLHKIQDAKEKEQPMSGAVVVISPDNAFKYISFFEEYLADAGKPKL